MTVFLIGKLRTRSEKAGWGWPNCAQSGQAISFPAGGWGRSPHRGLEAENRDRTGVVTAPCERVIDQEPGDGGRGRGAGHAAHELCDRLDVGRVVPEAVAAE